MSDKYDCQAWGECTVMMFMKAIYPCIHHCRTARYWRWGAIYV